MPTNILMPALSPTMEKGNLAKWLKKEGDKVKSGDVLAEIETDKATMEVEAVDEGTLGKILVKAGTNDVAVNTPIAVLLNEGEKAGDIKVDVNTPAPKAAAPPAPSGDKVIAFGAGQGKAAPPIQKSGDRVLASPLAKRIAKQKGIDIARLSGSGPHGRIVERDVLNAPQQQAGPKRIVTDEFIRKLYEPGSYTEIPHDSMRKIIAGRLTESKQTIPHFYLTVDCELDALLETRKQMNAAATMKDGKPAYKLSVNDYVIKAMAMALHRIPDANVTWMDNVMLKHKHADVGVAVAIPGGLITPIVRKAEVKTLTEISAEMKDYAARAKGRKLLPHEYQGGSTAISNLGMYGIKEFAAVINPPHATILAVGAGEECAVVRKGEIVKRHMMSVTLATDHRAVDGALGAELLTAFKANIENPSMMLA
jgi:pyruvate dehydrogenase E2 component (dihydrolipoamide acetyltransferase)